MSGLAFWSGEVDGAIAVARGARLDFTKSHLVFLDVLLKREKHLLGIFRGHDDAALHTRLWSVGGKQNHVEEEIVGTVSDDGEVGVVTLHFLVGHFYLNLLLLIVVIVICHNSWNFKINKLTKIVNYLEKSKQFSCELAALLTCRRRVRHDGLFQNLPTKKDA